MELNIDPEWLLRMAEKEDCCIVSVGGLVTRSDAIIKAGQKYRHFKGNIYEVVRVESAFLQELKDGQFSSRWDIDGGFEFLACSDLGLSDIAVFYRSRLGDTYVRSLQNFTEIVDGVPRFQLLNDETMSAVQ